MRAAKSWISRSLTDPVLARTVGRHLWSGELSLQQLDDSRAVFRDIFINSLGDPRVRLVQVLLQAFLPAAGLVIVHHGQPAAASPLPHSPP